MLSIQPIEITKNELKCLLLAAVLAPPICTLAGALAMAPAASPAPDPAALSDGGTIVRMADSVPTLELAPSPGFASAAFTLMPAAEIPLEASLAIETVAVQVAGTTTPAPESQAENSSAQATPAPVPQASENAESMQQDEPLVLDTRKAVTGPGFPAEKRGPSPVFAASVDSVSGDLKTALPQATAPGQFVVQAGVFSKEANARRCREDLLRRGVSSAVFEHSGARGTTFHVVLGRYESWRETQRARKQLAADLHIELIATRLPMRSISEQVATI